MRPLLLCVTLCLLGGCGVSQSAQRQCPDRPAHCLTGLDCAYDRTRGCEVCRCADPAYTPIASDEPAGPPP